jgi:hypothetical protein
VTELGPQQAVEGVEAGSEAESYALDKADPGHRDLFDIPPVANGYYPDVAYIAGFSRTSTRGPRWVSRGISKRRVPGFRTTSCSPGRPLASSAPCPARP